MANDTQIWQRLLWVKYEPNNLSMNMNRPGIVMVCCPEPDIRSGETRFTVLNVYDASNDANAIAESVLNQKWRCPAGLFVQIYLSDSLTFRMQVMASLKELCTQSKD